MRKAIAILMLAGVMLIGCSSELRTEIGTAPAGWPDWQRQNMLFICQNRRVYCEMLSDYDMIIIPLGGAGNGKYADQLCDPARTGLVCRPGGE